MTAAWVNMDDYKDAEGRIDWAAHRAAQRANGEICRTCPAFLVFPKGYSRQCLACERLEKDQGEVAHKERVRCPKCRHAWEPDELLDEGDGTPVSCPSCGHDFEVGVRYQPSYTSPPLLPLEPEPDGEEEDGEEEEEGDADE